MNPGADAGADAANASGLRVDGVLFARGARTVLDRVSFGVARGRVVAVLGPSGAGKSTLLSLIAGFERPNAGTIAFDGADWRALDPVARCVGVSFDDAALHEHLSVAENLDLAARPLGDDAATRRARVAEMARALGVEALLSRRPSSLSAGERRRVSLGRAFVRRPQLALLDEPFANLDRANRFAVRGLIRALQRSTGSTTIVVTHDPTDALAIADDLLVLVGGRVRANGPAVAVAARPADLEVAQLVDDLGMESIALADGRAPAGCELSAAFAASVASRLAARGLREARLGVSPWRLALAPSVESAALLVEATVEAKEPAGAFTDLVARLGDGTSVRARLRTEEAQDLPPGERVRLAARSEDLHLFGGPSPCIRLD
jgi:ABC-type sugar transport system ATPase subunit